MVLKNYWKELSNKCKSNTQERFNYIMTEINKLKDDREEPDSADTPTPDKPDEDVSEDTSSTKSKNRELVLAPNGNQTLDYTEGDKGYFKFIIKDDKGDVVEGASILVNGVVQDTVSDNNGKVIISDYDFNATGEISIVFSAKCEGYFDSNEVTLICKVVEKE